MTISGSYSSTVLGNLRESGQDAKEVGVALLKKSQELDAAQMDALIPDAPKTSCSTGHCGQNLDVYA